MNTDQNILQASRAARFKYVSGAKPLAGYTIRRGIGIGGFGEVYFAISDAGKEVALKRIQRNLDVELRGVQNCLNLKHVNLISLWDIRTDEAGESWVVMEYVPGPSLRDIIEVTESGMPDHQIRRWFDPIAAGVEYLHDKGIVHRDLKPANIFLDEDANVIKIGDYGLSKFISCSQDSGQTETVGTFHYMAPEIGKGIYGKGIDIYAMGIVLYEMLTGIVPFKGESSQEIIIKHLTADANLDRVPIEYREVIRRSLLKDPEARLSSIGEMRQFLPWNSPSAESSILNAERLAGLKHTVRPDPEVNGHRAVDERLPDILGVEFADSGIRFGPLQDSSVGNRGTDEVLFIGDQIVQSADSLKPTAAAEPVARVVRGAGERISEWWNDHSVSTPLKVFVLLVSGFVITANSEWLLPLALGLGLVYLVYFGFRAVLMPSAGTTDVATSLQLTRRQKKQLVHAAMRQQLAGQETLPRTTTLVGSLLLSAIVCVGLNLLGLAFSQPVFSATTQTWSLFAASVVICTFATWILLIAGRYFEKSDGSSLARRFTMLIFGLAIGGLAIATGGWLNIEYSSVSADLFNPLHASQMVSDSGPVFGSLMFFGAVFGLVRWWRQTDPTRRTRLSVVKVGVCLIWAALLSHMLNFVPFWSCLAVAVISIAIQLSSPWIPTPRRQQILNTKSTFATEGR